MNTLDLSKPILRLSIVLILFAALALSGTVFPNDVYTSTTQARATTPTAPPVNFIDNVGFYVRQHYLDFLSREPDAAGLQFWSNEITSCGSNAACLEVKRINVSAAFFLSIEFQETGYLVYRFYKAAFGNMPSKPVPIKRSEFLPDTERIGAGVQVGVGTWQQKLEANKVSFANDFVTRSRFTSLYPTTMSAAVFVDTLNTNSGGAVNQTERNTLVTRLQSGQWTRAQVLRAVAEDQTLRDQEFRKAFVLLQYFGYLKRDPDTAPDTNFDGFNFWLTKLNQFNGDYLKAEMVKAFIVSIEYRNRFAQPIMTAYNNPFDPQLLRAVTAKGDVVDYFGDKNASGGATKLRAIRVKNSGNQVTNITLDSQSRISHIQAFNGTAFKISWTSATKFVLTALSADGSVQVNLPVDLASQTSLAESGECALCNGQQNSETLNHPELTPVDRMPRSGRSASLTVKNAETNLTVDQVGGSGLSTVNVKRCGAPVNDATVGLTIVPSDHPLDAYTIPAVFSGNGSYRASIPIQPSAGQGAEDLCTNIANALGVGCDALSGLPIGAEALVCARLAQFVTAVNPAAGAAVFAACEVGFVAARLYCATLGYSSGLGTPSLAELMCGHISEVVDRFTVGNLLLIPVIFIPGKGVIPEGGSQTAPATGPFPTFNIDAGGQVEIVSFTTSPADPAPFQDYLAEALITCAPPNTRVTLSIVGTDGYSDSATATISGDANVTLTVPGAAQGVSDTVTVTIANGPTRRIFLVF